MTVSLRLDAKITTSLGLSMQLQQAISLLQLTNLDLVSFLEGKALENPFLEVESPAAYGFQGAGRSASGEGEGYDDWLQNVPQQTTLAQLLARQLFISVPDERRQQVGLYLIDALDENGYLRISVKELARELRVDADEIESLLALMKTFEPVGIFSQSAQECLMAQVKESGIDDKKAGEVLAYFQVLMGNDLKALEKYRMRNGGNEEELRAILRTVNLNPAQGYVHDDQDHSLLAPPDLCLVVGSEGALEVQVNEGTLPRLRVESGSYQQLKEKPLTREEVMFCRTAYREASWIAKAVAERQKNMVAVATHIFDQQPFFLAQGLAGLKPMQLSDIAMATGLHESTVSRIVANKTIETPRGLMALKVFFSNGVPQARQNDPISSQVIKKKIADLIASEDGCSPLSDDDVVILLKRKGVRIARRTVAKYREALGIAPSHQRRRLGRMGAMKK